MSPLVAAAAGVCGRSFCLQRAFWLKACYRVEGVNHRKKCAALVAQYAAVNNAPGAPVVASTDK